MASSDRLEFDLVVPGLHGGIGHLQRLGHQVVEFGGQHAQLHLALAHARDIHQVVDQLRELVGLALHHRAARGQLGGFHARLATQHLQRHAQRSQRVAQLVRQRGDELVLAFVGDLQLGLPVLQGLQRHQHLAVLRLHLLDRAARRPARQLVDQRGQRAGRQHRRVRREVHLDGDHRAAGRGLLDLEPVGQPARAGQSHGRLAMRVQRSGQCAAQVLDAGPLVGDLCHQRLAAHAHAGAREQERQVAFADVLRGVAGDLRDGGDEAGAIELVQSEQFADLARAVTHRCEVLLRDADREDAKRHRDSLATTTVASSLFRAKSRNSTEAVRSGLRSRRPG
jgi:hypothetical protein